MPRISSNAPRVPEPASRPNTAMAPSGPPTSLQLVISPVKIWAICSVVRSVTVFSGLMTTATPSRAMTFSTAPSAFSSSERARLARPRSQVPPRTPSMPAPEPLPVYWG